MSTVLTPAGASTSAVVTKLLPEFERLRKRFPPGFDSSLTLPCLRRIQEERGHIAEEDIEALVAWLGVPRVQVDEVLSFYTQFRREPVGRWHLQVCRNVSCSMRGAEGLLGHLCRKLGVEQGATTSDGRFTVSTVECLGSCGTAPVVVLNEAYHENMSAAKVDALLDGLGAGS
ncbi:MAG: NADH-quinone oxidoreductase subunit NuoE [Rubrivivax sp.]|nr:NADH-quinone oxidoreductase subunit NuoE [Rubrivivax sp.]